MCWVFCLCVLLCVNFLLGNVGRGSGSGYWCGGVLVLVVVECGV